MRRLTILAPAPRWLVPIAAAGVVVIVATAVVFAFSSNRDAGTASAQPPAAPAAAAAPADPAYPADSRGTVPPSGEAAATAREYLRTMTTAIAAASTDTQTGSYAYVHVKMWAADDTLRPRGGSTTDTVVYEERRWRATDGSGRVTRIRPPGERSGPRPGTENYGPGGMSGAIPEPLSTDPPILAGQLNGIQPFLMGPRAAIRAVADVYAWHYPDRDVRAALLRVLCDTDGLLWQGNTVDRVGRAGVAISVDSDNGGTRDIAVFDEHTGLLLAHETIRLRNPAGLGGPTPSLVSYVLYLETGRRPAPA